MNHPIEIVSPSDLLHRTSFSRGESATVKIIEKTIYLIHRPIAQNTLNQFSPLLNHGIIDQWLSPRTGNPDAFERARSPPSASSIPRLHIGLLMHVSTKYMESETPLVYFVVVQGLEASSISKIVVREEFVDIMLAMFSEAIIGYNLVLSGAMLDADAVKVFHSRPPNGNLWFRAVQSIETMQGEEEGKSEVGEEHVEGEEASGDEEETEHRETVFVLC